MVRAVDLGTVLEGRGVVFDLEADINGNVGFETQTIDYFVSHPWCGSRSLKYLSLCIEFNLPEAIICSLVAASIGFIFLYSQWEHGRPCLSIQAVSMLVFSSVLLFKQKVIKSTQTVFLDRFCIDQSNVVLKREGIRDLSKVLKSSKELLILWSPYYFTRLWCIYELAAFSFLQSFGSTTGSTTVGCKPRGIRLVQGMVNTYEVLHVLLKTLSWMLYAVAHEQNSMNLVRWYPEGDMGECVSGFIYCVCVSLVPCTFLFSASFLMLNDRKIFREQIQNFSVADAVCALESDKTVLKGSIASWFGSISHFETWVRSGAFGHLPQFPSTSSCIIQTLPYIWQALDSLCTNRGDRDKQMDVIWFSVFMAILDLPRRDVLCWIAKLMLKPSDYIHTAGFNSRSGLNLFRSRLAVLLKGGLLAAVLFSLAVSYLRWASLSFHDDVFSLGAVVLVPTLACHFYRQLP